MMPGSELDISPTRREMHGLQAPFQIRKNPYVKYLSESARRKMAEAQAMEEDLDLRGELHLLRTRLMEQLEKREKDPEAVSDKEIRETIRSIKELVITSSEMVDKLKGYLPVGMLPVIFRQITDIIKENVKDENALTRIAVQLGRIRVPADRSEADRLTRAISDGKVPS